MIVNKFSMALNTNNKKVLKKIPYSYNYTNGTLTNIHNAMTDADSTTSGFLRINKNNTSEAYIRLRFDFSDLPDNATIISVTTRAKASVTNTYAFNYRLCYTTYYANKVRGTPHTMSDTATIYTIDDGIWTADELKNGMPEVWLTASRNRNYPTDILTIHAFGADMTVEYTT